MRGFSKAIIAGNITRDPELRSTPGGASVCSFSVAINRVFKDSSGTQKEEVSFIDCSAWGKLGEMISQYAKKGSSVLVSGRLSQRTWEDKTSGQKRSRVEIVVEDFNFAGASERNSEPRNNSNNYNNEPAAQENESGYSDDMGDEPIDLSEIPF